MKLFDKKDDSQKPLLFKTSPKNPAESASSEMKVTTTGLLLNKPEELDESDRLTHSRL